MLDVVHITAQVINHSVTDKPQGALTRFLAKIAGKRQDVHLESRPSVVQLLVALAAARIIGIALRVRQNCLIALDLHVEQEVIQVHEFLLERVLEQDVVTRHRDQMIGGILLVEILVHPILSAERQLDVKADISHRVLEFEKGIHQGLTCILKGNGRHMRCKDDALNTHLLFSPQHVQRLLDGLRAMVHTREDVAMDVGFIEQLYLFFLGSEYIA